MPNNFESIFGGIFRGLSSNKSSAGTNSLIPTQQNNPLVYGWIGQETNDLRYPISKEQTQNPVLGPNLSSGTQFAYSSPVPTDIPTQIQGSYPTTDVSRVALVSSRIGSMVQPIPCVVPINNGQFNGYEMSPVNGQHFFGYFANQLGMYNLQGRPNAANVLTAIQAEANVNSDGSSDLWNGAWQTILSMRKSYDPNASNHWQGLRQS